ncbi:MAG: glycerate 2-kinase [Acidobacteriota bacterium]|nr:glycerate 2-kinase [Acidobacteriota bacterium]
MGIDRLDRLARRLVAVALAAIDPERLVAEELARREDRGFGAVVALGKAAAAMARGAEPFLSPDCRRLLLRPHTSPALALPGWEELSGGHPLPDAASVASGERLFAWLSELSTDQPLLALVSGGASAAVELPAPGLTLADLAATQRALLSGGVAIGGVNAVRKHLSRLKGGGALRAGSGPVLALLLSDVPGDDPAVLASGPFTADPSTFGEALAALSGLTVPAAVRAHLAAGARGERPETVKPGDPALGRVEAVLLAGVRSAGQAVSAALRGLGFTVMEGDLAGEAAAAGAGIVARGRGLSGERVALVLGGETTVTLGEKLGVGGRNQELALAAARALAGGSEEEAVLALATDGEDGPTAAAGAVVDGRSWEAMRRAGVDPGLALLRHDSHTALARGDHSLLRTGPTGTNAADLAVYLRVSGE